MKRTIAVAAALLCLAASGAGAEETIRIGTLFSVTGGQASLDGPALRGAMLAVREINGSGGLLGKTVELVQRDGRTETETVRRAMEDLIHKDRVAAVVGLSDSTYVLAAGPIAQAAGVPFLSAGATLPSLPEQVGNCLFLAAFGDDAQGQAAARFVHEELGMETAWILTDEASDFTRALTGFFRERFVALAGQGAILGEETYRTGERDLTRQIAKLRALKTRPEVLFVSALPEDCGRIVNRLRAAGVETPVVSGDGFDTPLLLKIGGPAARHVWFATHLSYENRRAAVQAFVKAYQKAYGRAPENAFAALGFDAMHLTAAAVKKAGAADPALIRDALAGLTGFKGLTGRISYGEGKRVPEKGVTIIRVDKGKFRFAREIVP